MNLKHLFTGKHHKSGSHSISHLFKGVGNVVKDIGNTTGKGVTTIYKDGRSAVSYAGKHIIKDVDKVSSVLSNPMVIIGVGAVVVILMMNRR